MTDYMKHLDKIEFFKDKDCPMWFCYYKGVMYSISFRKCYIVECIELDVDFQTHDAEQVHKIMKRIIDGATF